MNRPDQPNHDVWPNCVILGGKNPASLKAPVQSVLVYSNKCRDILPILTVACSNKWAGRHYLLPDNRFRYGMLDALAEVMGKSDSRQIHGSS